MRASHSKWGATKAKGQMVKIEYFCDANQRTDYYSRALPHGALKRMDRGGVDDAPPELLGVITAEGFSSGTFPDALPDQPATPIT